MTGCKKVLSWFLTVALLLSLSVTAFAATSDTGFSDVAADAWYTEAVEYVRDNGLMNGTGPATFSPEGTMTRGMLATILYRAAGSPAVSSTASFPDVPASSFYARGVAWAVENNVVAGYTDGRFGLNDPVSRQQIATLLWRYDGSKTGFLSASFTDSASISGYAVQAVDWAVANGIVAGRTDGSFDPTAGATRAQVAVMLHRYLNGQSTAPETDGTSRILVAYFSVPETSGVDAVASASRVVENGQVTGNVEYIAQIIQKETNADIFSIQTVQTYPGTHQELLDFAAAEMEANARPVLSTQISNLDDYDVIFLGYPIWNADLPMPMYTFLDNYDLSGKTVIPFTAHGGSGFAGTISTIAAQEPNAEVERDGFSVSRNSVADAKDDIIGWVQELGYQQSVNPAPVPTPPADTPKTLVVYVSLTGTTQAVAERIAEQTGGDLAEIQRAQPYGDLQSEAQAEINNGAQPEITVAVDNLDEYDVIFIGYPIWWDDAPAMISTFLAENNFDGKIIAPFCTSAYSSIDNSLHVFRELATHAVLYRGLTVNSIGDLSPWVESALAQDG